MIWFVLETPAAATTRSKQVHTEVGQVIGHVITVAVLGFESNQSVPALFFPVAMNV